MLYYYLCPFLLKTQVVCSDSTELLQSMILSKNKNVLLETICFTIWASSRETCLQGFRSGKTRTGLLILKKTRILAYSSLSNYTFQVANNKSVDQPARMRRSICTFVVGTCNLQVSSRRGSNIAAYNRTVAKSEVPLFCTPKHH